MEENKFEKKVKQRMEELRLSPSANVWDRIEEELQRKKKRRVVFFILSLAGLLLLSGTGYLISSNQLFSHESRMAVKNTPSVNQSPAPLTGQPVAETANAQKQDTKLPATATESEKTFPAIMATPAQPEQEMTAKAPGKNKNEKDRLATPVVKRSHLTADEMIGRSTANQNKKDHRSVPHESNIAANTVIPGQVTKDETKTNNSAAGETNDKTASVKSDAVPQQQVNADPPAKTTVEKTDSAQLAVAPPVADPQTQPAVKKQEKKKTIQWELQFSAGVADQRTIPTEQKYLPPALSSPQYGGTTNINGNIALNSPSPIRTGKAFGIGLLAEWKITKRSSFKAGLKYQFLGNSIKVGSYMDSAISFNNSLGAVRVDALYRGVQRKTFHNRYHLVEVPLAYQLQLNKGKKIPILWQSGVSLGYLAGTNALLYDEGLGGIYYHKSSLFNRFYATLNTGFAFRFGTHNRVSWSLGPDLSWGLSGIGKEGYDKKQKFVYGGLVGKVQLGRKK